jgi:hypothetical protein
MWVNRKNIFNKHHSQLPIVDVYDDKLRIYYSTRVDNKSLPMWIDVDINDPSIILNESKSPILNLGDAGYFDASGIMPTDIVNINSVKYMYYIGWSRRLDVPYHNNLGLAISNDNGETWNKYSKGPVFHTSYKEPGYIGTVDILVENDEWKMWYLSCREWITYDNKLEPIYDIKYATSINGIDWNPTNITCIELENDEGGISSSRIIKHDSLYHMWFSVRDKFDYRDNPNHSYRIKKATSKDGLVWKRENNIELDISNNDWDNIMVCYPEIIKIENKYHMFYNGNNFGKTGIGHAERETIN